MNGGGSTPVCGSDGITYSNQCQIISKQCQGVSILIKHIGPCPGLYIFYITNIILIMKYNIDNEKTKFMIIFNLEFIEYHKIEFKYLKE